MVSVEERMKVLNLLQTGAITADQAAQLLQAMDSGRAAPSAAPSGESSAWDDFPAPAAPEPYAAPEPPAATEPYSSDQPAVPDQRAISMPAPAVPGTRARWLIVRVSDMKTGRPRVNVRLPLSLVGFGLKMGRQFAPELEGMDISELANILQTGEPGPYVDVYDEDDGEHVEVFLE
jgi:hypothetical protein